MKSKRILSAILAAAISLAAISTSLFASGAAETGSSSKKSSITATASDEAIVWDGKTPMGAGKNYIIKGNIKISKNLTIPKGVTLTVADGATLTVKKNAKLTISGEINVDAKAALNISGKLTTSKSGTANVAGELKASTSAVLDVKGTLNTEEGSNTKISGALNIYKGAAVEVAGTFAQTNSAVTKITGSFTAAEGSSVRVAGTMSVTNSGKAELDGKVTTSETSKLKVSGELDLGEKSNVEISGALSVSKNGDLVVDGELTVDKSATVTANGTITIEKGSDVTIDGTMNLSGTAKLDGDGKIEGTGKIIADEKAEVKVDTEVKTETPATETPSTPSTPSTPETPVTPVTPATYTVTFDANGGTAGTKVSQTGITSGGKATLPTDEQNPDNEGYLFIGWNTKADGTGTEFTADTAVTANITVYAQWTVWLTGIKITSLPAKYIYTVGDKLDIHGMEIIAIHSNKSVAPLDINSMEITGFDSSKPAAKQTITVTFLDFTDTFDIVIEAAAVACEHDDVTVKSDASGHWTVCDDCDEITAAAADHKSDNAHATDCAKASACTVCSKTLIAAGTHTSDNAHATDCAKASACTVCSKTLVAAGAHDTSGAGGACSVCGYDPVAFKAVTGITGVATTATAETPLTLSGTVAPADATNQTIVWSVKSAGTTGATISGSTLSTTAAGTVTVTATIANGLTASSNYTQDFTITVDAATDTLVTAAAVAGVTAPVTGATPVTTTTAGTGFTGAVSWNGTPSEFAASTTYTATITLTAATGYTFTGGFTDTDTIAEFTVTGAEAPVWVSNNGTTLVFTVEFPATAAAPLTPVTNVKSAADTTFTYAGSTIDVSALFTLDTNAGAATYAIVAGAETTGTGSISDTALTITKAGNFKISVVTAATATHEAGAEVTSTITVNKGVAPAAISEDFTGTFPVAATTINLSCLAASAAGLEAAVAIDGSTYAEYATLTVAADGTATISGLSGVTTSTKVKVRVAATDTYSAGTDKEITVTPIYALTLTADEITSKSTGFMEAYYAVDQNSANFNKTFDNKDLWYFDVAGTFDSTYINAISSVELGGTALSKDAFKLSVGADRKFDVNLYEVEAAKFRIAMLLIALEKPNADNKLVFTIKATGYDDRTVTITLPAMSDMALDTVRAANTGFTTVADSGASYNVTWNSRRADGTWNHMLLLKYSATGATFDATTVFFTKKLVTKGSVVSTSYGFTKAENAQGELGFYPTIYDDAGYTLTYSVATASRYGVAVTTLNIAQNPSA